MANKKYEEHFGAEDIVVISTYKWSIDAKDIKLSRSCVRLIMCLPTGET